MKDLFDMSADRDGPDGAIGRGETGKRILLALLFALIWQILEMVVALTVAFELLVALITMRRPNPRIRRFGWILARYTYEVIQYLTYNSDQPPFPFSNLPTFEHPIQETGDEAPSP